MHVLIPLLVFAAGALGSPMEPEKRAAVTFLTTIIDIADTVYVTATPAADTPVVLVATSTPDAYQLPAEYYQPDVYQLPAESTTYHRHRHAPKLGSPRPAIPSPPAPTPKQLEVSIQTLTSTSTPEVIQSKPKSIATSVATVPSKTAVDNVQFQPPTTFVPNLDTTSYVYKALVLQHHNIHRRNHSAPDLTWSDQLAQYAETTAKTCKWGHSS